MPAAVPENVVAPAKKETVSTNKSPALPAKRAEVSLPPVREAIAVRPTDKTPEKIAEKKSEKTPAEEARRAAAILAGKASEAAAISTGTTYVILLGAFSNAANVKQLESKIGELGIKTFTESLDSPEGKKTRLRAGPFSSRDSADKALDRMKRIGVSGAVAAKQ
jgi:DedD protein